MILHHPFLTWSVISILTWKKVICFSTIGVTIHYSRQYENAQVKVIFYLHNDKKSIRLKDQE